MIAFKPRILKPPSNHFFLLGPRGTGKTVWLQHTFPNAIRVDLLDPGIFREYAARPEVLRERVQADPTRSVVLIDEVQKLPTLLEVVHLMISQGATQQFVMSGSSARKLRRGNVNLLGGRAVQRHMHPYIGVELGKDFELERALMHGLIPVIVESQDPIDSLKAYTALYIREEVHAEGLVRSAENFARFLEAISYSQGSILNISNISRECAVPRKSVEEYVRILEDLLLGFTIPVFTKRAKRSLASQPKFYFFDVGVYRTIRPSGPLDDSGGTIGIALETLVAQHLRAWCDYTSGEHTLSYWRTRTQIEVDFVVYGPLGIFAIEVKNSSTVHPKDLNGLKAFKKDYPEAQCVLLYRGKERLMKGDILCIPCDEFFKVLTPDKSPVA